MKAFIPSIALALGLISGSANASVIYKFVTTAFTVAPELGIGNPIASRNIILTISDEAFAAGSVHFFQTFQQNVLDAPKDMITVGSGLEQMVYRFEPLLPLDSRIDADDAPDRLRVDLTIRPDRSLGGSIEYNGLFHDLRMGGDSAGWHAISGSDLDGCAIPRMTCTFEGFFAEVPEPGTFAVFGVGLVALGFVRIGKRDNSPANVRVAG